MTTSGSLPSPSIIGGKGARPGAKARAQEQVDEHEQELATGLLVQRWARFCEFRGDRTCLREDLEMDLGSVSCPMFKGDPPWDNDWWSEVSRLGGDLQPS